MACCFSKGRGSTETPSKLFANHTALVQLTNHNALGQLTNHNALGQLTNHNALGQLTNHNALGQLTNHNTFRFLEGRPSSSRKLIESFVSGWGERHCNNVNYEKNYVNCEKRAQ